MKLTEFDKTKFGIEGTGIQSHTKTELVWKDKVTNQPTFSIPAGVSVHIDFSPKLHPDRIYITFGDEIKISRTQFASDRFTGISKPPSLKSLEKQCNDGIVKSVTGKRVEPDGWGPDGSPSWLLVISLI